jgi:predicted NAD/FAD-dependent oxidoreductase
MNSGSKHLACGLYVRTGERALQVNGRDGVWETRTASGRREIGVALLLTAPVPQSLTLLRSACVELPDEVGYKLENISSPLSSRSWRCSTQADQRSRARRGADQGRTTGLDRGQPAQGYP